MKLKSLFIAVLLCLDTLDKRVKLCYDACRVEVVVESDLTSTVWKRAEEERRMLKNIVTLATCIIALFAVATLIACGDTYVDETDILFDYDTEIVYVYEVEEQEASSCEGEVVLDESPAQDETPAEETEEETAEEAAPGDDRETYRWFSFELPSDEWNVVDLEEEYRTHLYLQKDDDTWFDAVTTLNEESIRNSLNSLLIASENGHGTHSFFQIPGMTTHTGDVLCSELSGERFRTMYCMAAIFPGTFIRMRSHGLSLEDDTETVEIIEIIRSLQVDLNGFARHLASY